MKAQPEFEFQKSVCKYLNLQYPNVAFMSDTIAAIKLTMPQASRNKSVQKDEFKCPDLIIFEPKGIYCGMFLELKVETPFKKNGELKTSDHLQAQHKTIKHLQSKGYYAEFCWSFDTAKKMIDDYLQDSI